MKSRKIFQIIAIIVIFFILIIIASLSGNILIISLTMMAIAGLLLGVPTYYLCKALLKSNNSDAQKIEPKEKPQVPQMYITDCFNFDFQEIDETRRWLDVPEAKAIVDTGAGKGRPNEKTIEEALVKAAILREKYPDYYFSYYWFAALFNKQRRFDDARNSISDGLRLSKSKYDLCNMMGDTEWESNKLIEAVKWWIRSVVLQVSNRKLGNYSPFLNLSYIAQRVDCFDVCINLRQFVDEMEAGGIRLTHEEVRQLQEYASKDPDLLKKVIEPVAQPQFRSNESNMPERSISPIRI